jgi:hypothetical protein
MLKMNTWSEGLNRVYLIDLQELSRFPILKMNSKLRIHVFISVRLPEPEWPLVVKRSPSSSSLPTCNREALKEGTGAEKELLFMY